MRIGIDLVAIKKFARVKKTDYAAWDKVFTPREWAYAFRGNHASEHLAGMFAAKEAWMKASGRVGVKNVKKIEVTHTAAGAPLLNRKQGRVSISHDKAYAVAVVLIG